jgi:hypothetical protein
VTTSCARFPKPVTQFSSIFGNNITASEGEDQKRYRKIATPAFSEVCTVLSKASFFNATSREIFGWYGMKPSVSCSTSSTMSGETVPKSWWISFTRPLHSHLMQSRIRTPGTWALDLIFPLDHQIAFKDALRTLTKNLILKVCLPNWERNLTERTRRVAPEFNGLKVPPDYVSMMPPPLMLPTAIYG